MCRRSFIIIGFLLFYTSIFSQSIIDKVDLFIGTEDDHGQLDPSATVPFGMVKVGPDTYPTNHSGYNYRAKKIKGFSHNRIGGVGCGGAGGSLRILPTLGKMTNKAYSFNKNTEKASPAYYAVKFDNNIKAELTANNYTAFHRYTFPESDSAFINFNLESSFAKFISSSKTIISPQEFAVTVSATNVCSIGKFTVHYYIKCSKVPIQVNDSSGHVEFYFKTKKDETVNLFVTTSVISQEDAKEEWERTSSKLTFKKALAQGEEKWTKALSRIEVEGNKEYEKLFYTHLYHSLLNPVKSENGRKRFKGTDGQFYTSTNYEHYDSWSMWDNFRDKFSLLALVYPEVSSDISKSLIDLYKYGKKSWSGTNESVPTVRTEHTIITLLDFYQRGINDFSIKEVYPKMCDEVLSINDDTPDKKLEKSYDLWALSEFAKILGKEDDHKQFLSQSMKYKDVWRTIFSKMDDQSDIMKAKGLYQGTVWQYRWHVQFDIKGLIDLFGSKEYYTNQLEYFFDNNLYNHGNQPDLHAPFMFNYGAKPWLTQKWVNMILTKEMYQCYGGHKKWKEPYYGRVYKAEPKGYISEMDDDEGTMSSWYVLSAIGLYPLEVGKPIFQLTSPIFDKIVIHLGGGKTFVIITENYSDENIYIKDIVLNGKPFDKLSIDHDDVINGGEMIIKLSDIPNKSLGKNN